MLARMSGKGNPCLLLVGKQTGTATMEISLEVSFKKLKPEFPCDSARPLPHVYIKHATPYDNDKDTLPSVFFAGPFTIVRTWNQLSCSSTNLAVHQLS